MTQIIRITKMTERCPLRGSVKGDVSSKNNLKKSNGGPKVNPCTDNQDWMPAYSAPFRVGTGKAKPMAGRHPAPSTILWPGALIG